MIPLLQITPPTIPGWEWWASYGVMGVIFFVVGCMAIAYAYKVEFPDRIEKRKQDRDYQKAKQDLEVERDQKLNTFIDRLSETHGTEIEIKRQGVEAQRQAAEAFKQQTALLSSIDQRQQHTHKLVEDIHRRGQ